MSGSGRNSLLDVREWTGGPLECPGVVGRPSQMSGNDRDALPGCLAVVGRPSRKSGRQSQLSGNGERPFRMFESDRDAPLDVREWTGGPPGCQEVVRRPSWMTGRGREDFPNF